MGEAPADDTIVVSRVRAGEAPPVHGAIQDLCGRCGFAVWLAPSSQQIRRLRYFALVCVHCAAHDDADRANMENILRGNGSFGSGDA